MARDDGDALIAELTRRLAVLNGAPENPAAPPDDAARNATWWRDKFARAEVLLGEIADAVGEPRASDYSGLPAVVARLRQRRDEAVAWAERADRERDEARDERDRLFSENEELTSRAVRLMEERDVARAQIRGIQLAIDQHCDAIRRGWK